MEGRKQRGTMDVKAVEEWKLEDLLVGVVCLSQHYAQSDEAPLTALKKCDRVNCDNETCD